MCVGGNGWSESEIDLWQQKSEKGVATVDWSTEVCSADFLVEGREGAWGWGTDMRGFGKEGEIYMGHMGF